ncbi:hypothetical protein OPQ81_008711 [Rhizoctonia solani]|nr:hypothetical protein OPQ81_008711 [Rhizoctonia solani]
MHEMHKEGANTILSYDKVAYPHKSKNLTQSQPCGTTCSECSYLLPSSSIDAKSTKPSLEPSSSYPPLPSPCELGGIKSSPHAESVPIATLPAPTKSGNSNSSRVQFSKSEDKIKLGEDPPRHSPHTPKSPSKTVLKNYNLNTTNTLSHSIKKSSTVDASTALDNLLIDLVTCVNNFKCPSELDFSANTGSPLILANVEKNKAFIKQLRNLDDLRTRWAKILTHDDAPLNDKHAVTGLVIRQALQRMKEHHLKLYGQFVATVESALDDITINLEECLKHPEYPSKLDFPANSEDGLTLLNTQGNKPFINQLRRLDWLRKALNDIPPNGDERLQNKRKVISATIGRHLKKMKEHQLNLYRRQSKGYRRCHI